MNIIACIDVSVCRVQCYGMRVQYLAFDMAGAKSWNVY